VIFLIVFDLHSQMAHRNLQERREFVARLTHYGITFNSVLVADLARAFGCSPSAIRVDVRVVGKQVSPGQLSFTLQGSHRE
jgi:hypothetical protein